MPVNQPALGPCVTPQVDDLITSLRGPASMFLGSAHASPKPYLYCTTRSRECLKKFMSCASPLFLPLLNRDVVLCIICVFRAMQFVDCILIGRKRNNRRIFVPRKFSCNLDARACLGSDTIWKIPRNLLICDISRLQLISTTTLWISAMILSSIIPIATY